MRKDSSSIEVSITVSPIRNSKGIITGASTISHDITERKQAEAAIQESSQQKIDILESITDAFFALDTSWRMTYVNKQAELLMMLKREELIGRNLWEIFPEAVGSAFDLQYHKAVAEGVAVEFEAFFPPHGAWYAVHAYPSSSGLAVYYQNVNERKRAAEVLQAQARDLEMLSRQLKRTNTELSRQRDELAILNSALEEASRVRSQFLATMSHELRTPLTSIIGFSQMLLDDAQEAAWNQEHQNSMKRILKNGQHLLSLINDVRELLTSIVEEIQPMALAQHLVLRAEVAEGVDFLESHPLKLRQILINLVSNAIKFTERGEVALSARHAISSDTQADSIALAVQDSGVGIPADIHAHIFEAFYQADGSYTRKVGGTGLGLSIVNQLTTLLGGTIEVTSALGQGSTFTVLLPIKAVHHNAVQAPPRLHPARQAEVSMVLPSSGEPTPALPGEGGAVPAHRAAALRDNNLVLAIDDNPDTAVLIRAALKGTPYTVVGVQDSLQTMELVQELHPCAITLDVMMPNVNGWQILHQLKENPATASIPVVMLTVLSEPTTGYVLGADDYLMKPLMSDALLNTLHHLAAPLQGSSPASERETQPV